MERYNKYLVLKIADIEKYLNDDKQMKFDALVTCIRVGRLHDGKKDQQYVCVAADWPMYEQVWGMVEAFVDNKPSEIEQLRARIAELEAQSDPEALHIAYLQGQATANETTRKQADRIKELEADQAAAVLREKQWFDSVFGLSYGTDWNNGPRAEIYRPKLAALLTAPISTEALDAYVAEKVKEAMK
ncbi:hypothetical protein AB6Q56_14660 [Dechloromonas sp. ARDL1]|uniref:hypothetical protein n=1 Tax=Dechloromonas sp. ARDL1 TaxID=3322121 RepID=UPI003DA799B4